MAKSAFKLSTMVGENFEMYSSDMTKMLLKLSIMIEENFKYTSQMDKMASTKYIFISHLLLLSQHLLHTTVEQIVGINSEQLKTRQ